jgi:hypothetical protein
LSTIAIINGSECYVRAGFLDTKGNPYTPTSLTYSVQDLTNGVQVLAPTSVLPAASVSIALSASVNTMNPASNLLERRSVVLKVGVPGGSYRNDVVEYQILAAQGTP